MSYGKSQQDAAELHFGDYKILSNKISYCQLGNIGMDSPCSAKQYGASPVFTKVVLGEQN